MGLSRIISGGQTGVDRGALDAALARGFPCGGWCPPGRMAEDGPIDECYPLRELDRGGYAERTRENVVDADATLIIHFGRPAGGTELTVSECLRHGKPHLLVDAEQTSLRRAAELIAAFLDSHEVDTLNVAGPRRSEACGARDYAFEVIGLVLEALASR